MEQKYIQEAFDTNWVVPLGPNVNGFEKILDEFVFDRLVSAMGLLFLSPLLVVIALYLLLRPGITGPATMKYRDEETLLAAENNPQEYNDTVIWPDKVRINLYYLHHFSFRKDLQMIVTLLGRKMEYGGEMI
ncbi:MAG: sugar transferase [Bacteroidaceae bacterium]|nr:sugar transferase [Bacteroidaceae bacterium]